MIRRLQALMKKLMTREVITYVIFGVLTTLVNYAALFLFQNMLHIPLLWANALAWVAAVAFAYVTNKLFVFESRSWAWKNTLREIVTFTGGRVTTLLLEEGGLLLFVELLRLPAWPVKIALSVMTVILNYVFSKLIIFTHKK